MKQLFLRLGVVSRASLLALVSITCAGRATRAGDSSTAPADVPRLYEAQRQVEEYIRSGRYDGDFAKVVARAREWLEQRSKTATKPAIVLDIDETSLSN